MFSDPQSVTVSSVAQSLPRTEVEGATSTYKKEDDTYQLTISHSDTSKGRVRRSVRLDGNKISADAFTPAENRRSSLSVYIVIDEPADGAYTNAQILADAKGLIGWCSDANLTKVIAGES